MRIFRGIVLGLVGIVATHCSKDPDRAGPEPAPSASVTPAAKDAQTAEPSEDSVTSVYPLDAGAPDPLVHKLCAALHDLPEQRRAACCQSTPSIVFTSECNRTLTAAVHFKAVALESAEVDRCIEAMGRAYDGCEWVGPWPPEMPAECEGIIHGVLAKDARCRSSLECAEGLRCQGAGPTSAGRCGPPRPDGSACGAAVDPLVAFAKQTNANVAHPECTGYCDHLRCDALVPMGGVCRVNAQCANGGCAAGKCVPHVVAKPGEACPTGECSEGARCLEGKCVQRKPSGAVCKSDFECLGGCVKSDGGAAMCGRRCDVR